MSHVLKCSDDNFNEEWIWENATAKMNRCKGDGSGNGILVKPKGKDVVFAIKECSDLKVDMRGAEISDTLTLGITGINTTVLLKHHKTLRLIIGGENCHVINECDAASNSIIRLIGKESTYKVGQVPVNQIRHTGNKNHIRQNDYSFSTPTQVIVTLGAVGLLAYLWSRR